MGLRVSRPRDSENPLRSAYFFSKKIFFGIFLTTILKINPKINPNINPFFSNDNLLQTRAAAEEKAAAEQANPIIIFIRVNIRVNFRVNQIMVIMTILTIMAIMTIMIILKIMIIISPNNPQIPP